MSSELKDEEKKVIINALKVIKQTCLSYKKICDIDGCTICPLRADIYGCAIEFTPVNWNINESNEWRAIL